MKKYLNFVYFLLVGIIFGIALIMIFEFSGFSHSNLIPFGGKSWALWSYPAALFFGLFVSAFLFKIKHKFKILLLIFIFVFALFFLVFNRNLFVNPVPFGK